MSLLVVLFLFICGCGYLSLIPFLQLTSTLILICAGDHLEEVAEMIVTKFGVSGDAVFLDLDGEFVSYA